jgi:arylsulfatase A-like enzyme
MSAPNPPIVFPPSFNEADVADKPAWIQAHKPLSAAQIARMTAFQAKRIRSVMALDEAVERLMLALHKTSQLKNTHVIFYSDNGHHLGEHRLRAGKVTPYDEDVRVPFVARGPEIPPGIASGALTLNVDLAPTILKIAGVTPPEWMDGQVMLPVLRGKDHVWRRTSALLERPVNGVEVPGYAGIRTVRYTYVEFDTGERELYDHQRDPHQLRNLAASAAPCLLATLSARVASLKACVGVECRRAESEPLAEDCGGGSRKVAPYGVSPSSDWRDDGAPRPAT